MVPPGQANVSGTLTQTINNIAADPALPLQNVDRLNAREGDLVGEPLAPAIVHYVREECRGGDDVPHEDLVEHLAEPPRN